VVPDCGGAGEGEHAASSRASGRLATRRRMEGYVGD
jgi:hypothetical protein